MRKITKVLGKVIDVYLIIPILCDYLIIALVLIISQFKGVFKFILLEKEKELALLSTLIGTTVSMAGFILAALTIIVTFKSSLTARGLETANNALEYLFKTVHYKKIVGVFKKSLIELTAIFIVLYISWLCAENISERIFFDILLSSTISMSLSIFRSLLILFKVMSLEFMPRP